MAENTLLEKVLSLEGKFQSIQDQLSDPSVMSSQAAGCHTRPRRLRPGLVRKRVVFQRVG